MKLCDRQLKLDTINYRNKTKAGTYNYCSKCTGCYMGNGCIFSSPYRSTNLMCAKAWHRYYNMPINSLYELVENTGKRDRHYYMYGLHKNEMGKQNG